MDIQLYIIHVVPFILIVYFAFVLFMHPAGKVVLASIIGGLLMAVINMLGDLAAYYAAIWHYTASGLVLHLPLPFYLTQWLIYGGLAYLLIWRLWGGRWRGLAIFILVGTPLIGFGRDLLNTLVTHSSFLDWNSPLAGPLDFLLWVIMFYAGYALFRRLAPEPEKAEE
ncbi:MAG TPA: hypothetical protein VFA41_11620 [Ktedonobacteraceae bacterium]|jgi:hypothetical protein|nr:hypothetical protein [Ktedonobacteraceae bacterium]